MSMSAAWWDREGGERVSSPLRFLEVDYAKCNKYHLCRGQVWRVSISSVTGERQISSGCRVCLVGIQYLFQCESSHAQRGVFHAVD